MSLGEGGERDEGRCCGEEGIQVRVRWNQRNLSCEGVREGGHWWTASLYSLYTTTLFA